LHPVLLLLGERAADEVTRAENVRQAVAPA